MGLLCLPWISEAILGTELVLILQSQDATTEMILTHMILMCLEQAVLGTIGTTPVTFHQPDQMINATIQTIWCYFLTWCQAHLYPLSWYPGTKGSHFLRMRRPQFRD